MGTHRRVQQPRDWWITISDKWTAVPECCPVTENIQHFGYCGIRIPAVFPQKVRLWEAEMCPGLKEQAREKRYRSQLSPNFYCEDLSCHEVGSTHNSKRDKCRRRTWTSFNLCRWTSVWHWHKCLCLEKYSKCLYDGQDTGKYCLVRNFIFVHRLSMAACGYHIWGDTSAGDQSRHSAWDRSSSWCKVTSWQAPTSTQGLVLFTVCSLASCLQQQLSQRT